MTCKGKDPLLSAEDNCEKMVDPPNELEVSRAFTRKFNHLLCVMKAIHRFKGILARKRAEVTARSANSTPAASGETPDTSKDTAKVEVIEALLLSGARSAPRSCSGPLLESPPALTK